ncbi:MAG: hypothetical protein NVS3B5_06070 [Sphingomicrobium sp.]
MLPERQLQFRPELSMPTAAKPAIIDRSDPIFGVCEALGDDFGINAN